VLAFPGSSDEARVDYARGCISDVPRLSIFGDYRDSGVCVCEPVCVCVWSVVRRDWLAGPFASLAGGYQRTSATDWRHCG